MNILFITHLLDGRLRFCLFSESSGLTLAEFELYVAAHLGDEEIEAQEGLWRGFLGSPCRAAHSLAVVSKISQCGWLSREFCLFLWFPGLEPGASVLLGLGVRPVLVLNCDPGNKWLHFSEQLGFWGSSVFC